jgi:CubicO group peptidase (beta-lactamase class C family)
LNSTRAQRRTALLILTITFLLANAISFHAQVPAETNPAHQKSVAPAAPGTQQTAAPLTKDDIEAFLDGFMPMQLQREDIAGAVVLIVKDGKVLFAKGYGFADVKNRKPVTVDATLFRPGSISKTFTWTAVMQLVQQGKLDLNRDVNDYLDFKIPAPFGKPITLLDIMTHTPGFEEQIKDLFVTNASDVRPLNQFLPSHLPRQIFPPGTTPAYSNYATTVAGYIVQRVSGVPFNEYIEKNIFQPLGMNRTTFRQPLPDNLKPLMSEGYKKASEPARPYEFVQAWPAGSLSTTAEDMSHFMIAHLQDGEYKGARILEPQTAQLMHARAYTNLPQLNGMAHGFYEETRNGHRIIGHGGDTQWFHSDMHLMLDQNLGFFVSYNSAGKGDISPRSALWRHFLDRYYPYTPPAGEKFADSSYDAKSVAATYWSSRRAGPNIADVINAIGQTKVTANSNGTISVEGSKDNAGNLKHYEEIAPLLFREVNGQDKIGFKRDADGRLNFFVDFPAVEFQATPILKRGVLNLYVLGFAVAVFALTLLFWPVNAVLRWHYDNRLELEPRYLWWRRFMRLVCLVNLVFAGLFAMWLSGLQDNLTGLSSHFDTRLHLMQVLGLLALLGSVFSIVYCQRSWRSESVWVWTKIWNTLLMLACLGFIAFVLNWHTLNFNLRY